MPRVRLGREKKQGGLGRDDRRLRGDRWESGSRNERAGPATFPYRVRARSRPVSPRIQSAAVACEELQPCSYGRAIQDRPGETRCGRSYGTLETNGQEGHWQAETQRASQIRLIPYFEGRVLARGPFLVSQTSAATRRPRPVAIFCAMAMMSFRSDSAALLKHFRNLWR